MTPSIPAKQRRGKPALLLIVEAAVERSGSVGEFLAFVRAVDLRVGFLAHFDDRIDVVLLPSMRKAR